MWFFKFFCYSKNIRKWYVLFCLIIDLTVLDVVITIFANFFVNNVSYMFFRMVIDFKWIFCFFDALAPIFWISQSFSPVITDFSEILDDLNRIPKLSGFLSIPHGFHFAVVRSSLKSIDSLFSWHFNKVTFVIFIVIRTCLSTPS